MSVIRFYCFFFLFFLICSQIGFTQVYQSIDGSNNNEISSSASTGTNLLRVTDYGYSDGFNEMGGQDRMNPRQISNLIFAQDDLIFDRSSLSDFVWVFGQFVDHDITLIEGDIAEDASIDVLAGDKFFAEGSKISMLRNEAAHGTGTSLDNPREHTNLITGFIDASAVYGSDEERADWLRSKVDGKMKVSKGDLLPWNTLDTEFNGVVDEEAPFMADDTRSGTKLFVAGDVRANENPLLVSMHTLFVKEHNRLCDEFKAENPSLTDEQLYQKARRHVSAYFQNIVYNEWLPSMGVKLPEYSGYQSQLEPGIFNVFSASAFRLGHTLINSNIIRINIEGETLPRGNISLRDAFFNPAAILIADGIDPYFQGMATQVQQAMDCRVIDDVRNFLFGPPGTGGGLDLAAININRGRERGIPDFNTVRANFGLPLVNDFVDITGDEDEAALLSSAYDSVDNIDSWVGMLAENPMPDALFGQTIMIIMMRQFQLLRDGDRFYFENDPALSEEEKQLISNTSFRDIIMRNTEIDIMQENVFTAMPYDQIPTGPEIEEVQLAAEIYPNPTADVFNLKVYAEAVSNLNLRIIDNSGRTVFLDQKTLEEGNNFFSYDVLNSLSKGLYNIVIEQGINFKVLKLVKE
jgi:hypothetical protein